MLPHIRGLDRLSQQRCTAEVRELINDAAPVGQEPVDLRPLHLDPASRNQMKMLAGIIQSKAKELNIPSSLLANRRDLELLLENPSASRVLSGWRLGVVGQDLLNVLPDIRTPPSSPHVI
jgi:ribonuclease D